MPQRTTTRTLAIERTSSSTGTKHVELSQRDTTYQNPARKSSKPLILLKLIIAEKITENAERCIRYHNIETYDQLYQALRTQVSTPVTTNGCRNRLLSTRQGFSETVIQFSVRFRQALSELLYAVGILVIAANPKTLIEAQSKATDIELWTQDRNSRSNNTMKPAINNHPPPINRPIQQPNLIPTRRPERLDQPRTCIKNNCFQYNNFQQRQNGILPPRVNHLDETTGTDETQKQNNSTKCR